MYTFLQQPFLERDENKSHLSDECAVTEDDVKAIDEPEPASESSEVETPTVKPEKPSKKRKMEEEEEEEETILPLLFVKKEVRKKFGRQWFSGIVMATSVRESSFSRLNMKMMKKRRSLCKS